LWYFVDMQTATTTPNTGDARREEGLMASSEKNVREFAAQFPTPNTLRALALCEAGTLTWAQVAEIFRSSLAEGLEAVR
jgi:hypothetical protein